MLNEIRVANHWTKTMIRNLVCYALLIFFGTEFAAAQSISIGEYLEDQGQYNLRLVAKQGPETLDALVNHFEKATSDDERTTLLRAINAYPKQTELSRKLLNKLKDDKTQSDSIRELATFGSIINQAESTDSDLDDTVVRLELSDETLRIGDRWIPLLATTDNVALFGLAARSKSVAPSLLNGMAERRVSALISAFASKKSIDPDNVDQFSAELSYLVAMLGNALPSDQIFRRHLSKALHAEGEMPHLCQRHWRIAVIKGCVLNLKHHWLDQRDFSKLKQLVPSDDALRNDPNLSLEFVSELLEWVEFVGRRDKGPGSSWREDSDNTLTVSDFICSHIVNTLPRFISFQSETARDAETRLVALAIFERMNFTHQHTRKQLRAFGTVFDTPIDQYLNSEVDDEFRQGVELLIQKKRLTKHARLGELEFLIGQFQDVKEGRISVPGLNPMLHKQLRFLKLITLDAGAEANPFRRAVAASTLLGFEDVDPASKETYESILKHSLRKLNFQQKVSFARVDRTRFGQQLSLELFLDSKDEDKKFQALTNVDFGQEMEHGFFQNSWAWKQRETKKIRDRLPERVQKIAWLPDGKEILVGSALFEMLGFSKDAPKNQAVKELAEKFVRAHPGGQGILDAVIQSSDNKIAVEFAVELRREFLNANFAQAADSCLEFYQSDAPKELLVDQRTKSNSLLRFSTRMGPDAIRLLNIQAVLETSQIALKQLQSIANDDQSASQQEAKELLEKNPK